MGHRETGQILLIVAFIFSLLFLAIPIVVLVNQVSSRHHMSAVKSAKTESVAEEGLAFAIQKLSASQTDWDNTIIAAPTWPTAVFPDLLCNSGTAITSAEGGRFKLDCSNNTSTFPARRPYQVVITVTTLLPSPTGDVSGRRLRAYISKRTLGVRLASGYTAPAALELVKKPTIPTAGGLTVHWGPVAVFEPNDPTPPAWPLQNPLDVANGVQGYPRKFYTGDIQGGAAFPRNTLGVLTDNKEYWENTGLGFPELIDEDTYKTLAANNWGLAQPPLTGAGCPALAAYHSAAPYDCGGNPCGYFDVPSGCTAIFDGYSIANPATVIYVDKVGGTGGNAEFDNLGVDLNNGGAIIVTGDLTLKTRNPSTGLSTALAMNIPYTAPLEYPYWAAGMPCQTSLSVTPPTNYTCTATQAGFGDINIRGFVWAQGNLNVQQANWSVAGSVLVGNMDNSTGILDTTGGQVTVIYDDIIGHNIKTKALELAVDRLDSLSPSN